MFLDGMALGRAPACLRAGLVPRWSVIWALQGDFSVYLLRGRLECRLSRPVLADMPGNRRWNQSLVRRKLPATDSVHTLTASKNICLQDTLGTGCLDPGIVGRPCSCPVHLHSNDLHDSL